MKAFQRDFIEFAIARGVLKFGEFTLKSGRVSPYFFNAGLFNRGGDLAKLGRFYADALMDAGVEFDVLLGQLTKAFLLQRPRLLLLLTHTASMCLTVSTAKKPKPMVKAAI